MCKKNEYDSHFHYYLRAFEFLNVNVTWFRCSCLTHHRWSESRQHFFVVVVRPPELVLHLLLKCFEDDFDLIIFTKVLGGLVADSSRIWNFRVMVSDYCNCPKIGSSSNQKSDRLKTIGRVQEVGRFGDPDFPRTMIRNGIVAHAQGSDRSQWGRNVMTQLIDRGSWIWKYWF